MGDFTFREIIGGAAHTQRAPEYWSQGIGKWFRPGMEEPEIYEMREYQLGNDRYFVWVHHSLGDATVFDLLAWAQVTQRRELLAAQKELLVLSGEQAKNYTAAIMAAGFAALFALITQLKSELTPATLFAACGLLTTSAALFVGWEVFGMFLRGRNAFALGRALKDPDNLSERIADHRERTAMALGFYQVAWMVVSGLSALAGALCFIVLISAMVHGFAVRVI